MQKNKNLHSSYTEITFCQVGNNLSINTLNLSQAK